MKDFGFGKHTEKFKKIHLLILLKRRLRDGLILVCKYLPKEQISHSQFFNLSVKKPIMRFSSWKPRQDEFRFEAWSWFLTLMVVKHRHNLPRNVIDSPPCGPFILGLSVPLKHKLQFKQKFLRDFCGDVLQKVKHHNLLAFWWLSNLRFMLKLF